MTLDKVKIYLDGKMVVFATETDVLIASVPPGQFRIKPTDGDGFAFEDLVNNKTIAAVKDYDDVLDAAGATYGANQAAVLTALNAFVGFKSGGGVGNFIYLDDPSVYHTLQGDNSPNYGSANVGFANICAHLIKPLGNFEVNSVSINIISNVTAGNSAVAIYDLDSNGYPSTKLFQTSEYNNVVTGIQTIAVTPYTLEAGKNYAVAFQASNTISSIRKIDYLSSNNSLVWGNDGDNINYGLICAANAYTSDFPATFPAGGSLVSSAQIIAVFFQ
jgi:hypothetical protein